jgi:MauM/NapG family ferredoxin protein
MRNWRRVSQLSVFLVFSFLFLNTTYTDQDVLPYAVNVFLRLDPLVAGTAALAGRAIISLVWPALLTVGVTLLLGRVFCGWFCPLGAILDFVDATLLRRVRRARAVPVDWQRAKYFVLLFLLGSSVFTLQLVFLLDPLSLLIRSLTAAVYPAANFTLNELFGGLYATGIRPLTAVSEPIFQFLRNHFLAFEQPHFISAGSIGALFLGLLALEYLQPRFWCRNLCPLGALLGLLGRTRLIHRRVSEAACTSCGRCARACPTGAIKSDFLSTVKPECTLCVTCQAVCPEHAVAFGARGARSETATDLSRRGVLTSLALGAATVPVLGASGYAKAPAPSLIRPPGALPEKEFLARCTRCGECMRVCIANGLQPALLQAGLPGLWSPILVSRIGYCEYNCSLCGQVCPTGAIRRLTLKEKHKIKIGLAEVDRNHCLPWKGDSECVVCEEHCPTPEKAIRLRTEQVPTGTGEIKTFKRPYVDESRCVGCGICETKCPLTDRAGIVVTSRGESRGAELSVLL